MIGTIVGQRRLVLSLAVLLALVGVMAYLVMPQQEDPTMPDTHGLVVVAFPGADAEQVERLVVEPIEEHLAEVRELKVVGATARADVGIFQLELRDGVRDHDKAWDEVQKALRAARGDLPVGAEDPSLDRDLMDTESVVLAITGSSDELVLAAAAKRLERDLLRLPQVARVELTAVHDEQVRIEYDDAVARRFGIDARSLVGQLAARNSAVPGGAIRAGERRATLRPNAEFTSVEQIAETPILLASGAAVPLDEIASVRRARPDPAAARMRFNGQPAVAVGLIPHAGIHVGEFGRSVRKRVAEVAPAYAPLAIEPVVFQPDRVEARLSGLTRSLLLGILVVAGVLIGFMGFRLGLVVASVVPLVAASSLGLFAMGGGVLHQISIAALVLALGMLVDNAIVIAEDIQRRLQLGESRPQAVVATVRSLGLPLGAATGTTIAAFLPMLLSTGPTASFTRSIPVIVMLTLVVSYVFALTVTPIVSGMVLRPTPESRTSRLSQLARWMGEAAVRRRGWVLAAALVLVVGAGAAVGAVEQQFFPASDRNQLVVSLELPEGTELSATDTRARRLEAALAEHPAVVSVAGFSGRATPKFYYNILQQPSSPHLAQLLVTTRGTADVEPVASFARKFAAQRLPEVEVVARGLEQGPPVGAPVQLRLYGDDLDGLRIAAEQVMGALRAIPGTRDVRHELGTGVPSIAFTVDDASAARHDLSRDDVALALLGRTRGLEVGQLRSGAELMPIRLVSSDAEELPAAYLGAVDVSRPGGRPVPLAQLARSEVEWRPAVIRHRQRERYTVVSAELAPGVPFSRVLTELDHQLPDLGLPAGVRVEAAGAVEGSGQANTALLSTLPSGLFLLLLILLAEFNSFRRLAIVLATVPLAATGVIPGLVLAGQPFGFMSLLGVFALVGIVVNNAIVLLDVTEAQRKAGASVVAAVAAAVQLRTRPILLTTGTTVAGLLPLAVSDSTLWPPLAWAMISGLVASTGLTLLVTPALYGLLFRDGEPRPGRAVPMLAAGEA